MDLDAALDAASAERVRARLLGVVASHPWTAPGLWAGWASSPARLRVGLEEEGLRATLRVGPEPQGRLEALSPWPHGTLQAGDLERALGDALSLLEQMAALDGRGHMALCAQALSPEPAGGDPPTHFQLRVFAIRRLGERGHADAIEPLARLLQPEAHGLAHGREQRLAGHAAGALVALGHPAGVLPLIAWAQRKDAAVVRQVAFAVAELGGPVAEAYLVTLGSGHPDASVRKAAADALAAWAAVKP